MSGGAAKGGAANGGTGLAAVAVNLLAVVEHPVLGDTPYRVDADGRPYVPVGDGGLVLGVRLGDSVWDAAGDHVAPGACLVHPDQASRHALAVYACIGNPVEVRTGHAAGARGVVVGKRGEAGRVIAAFGQQQLALLRPGDQVSVRACGQGWRHPGVPPQVAVMNAAPGLLDALGVSHPARDEILVGVRAVLPSKLGGNGIGRPAAAWDLDLQLSPGDPDAAGLRLGDLVAICDTDARYNMGYRRGWLTVGVVVHGGSPLPGHGPGIAPILSGPRPALSAVADRAGHSGLTESALELK